MPARPFDQVAADGRAEQRPRDRAQAEERRCHAVLFARVAREENALRRRNDGAAAEPLQRAKEHERRQVPSQAAERARGAEQEHRSREIAAVTEAPLQPAGHRNDDDVRHHVAGRHPADLIDGRAEARANVVERDVDDRDVDHRHQRGRHDDGRDAELRPRDLIAVHGASSLSAHCRVDTVTVALKPGRSSVPGCGSSRTSTGTRCTTLVKLPDALSGGSSEKREPVPPARLSTWPVSFLPERESTVTVAGSPARIPAIWSSLKLATTQVSSSATTASSGRSGEASCPTSTLRRDTTPA